MPNRMQHLIPQYLPMSAVAAELNLSLSKAYKLAAIGHPQFPLACRLPNGQVRVAAGDLTTFLAEKTGGAAAAIAALGDHRTFVLMFENNEYLSISDLEVILGTSKHTLWKWAARGYPHFPKAHTLPNGEIRVTWQALTSWMKGRTR